MWNIFLKLQIYIFLISYVAIIAIALHYFTLYQDSLILLKQANKDRLTIKEIDNYIKQYKQEIHKEYEEEILNNGSNN